MKNNTKIYNRFFSVVLAIALIFMTAFSDIGVKVVNAAEPTATVSGAVALTDSGSTFYIRTAVEGDACSVILTYTPGKNLLKYNDGTGEKTYEIDYDVWIKIGPGVTLYQESYTQASIQNSGTLYILGNNRGGIDNDGTMDVYGTLWASYFSNDGEVQFMPGCDIDEVESFDGHGTIYIEDVDIDSKYSYSGTIIATKATIVNGNGAYGANIHALDSLTFSGYSSSDFYARPIYLLESTKVYSEDGLRFIYDIGGTTKEIPAGTVIPGKTMEWVDKATPSFDVNINEEILYGTNYDLTKYVSTNSDGDITMKYAPYYGGDYYGEASSERPTEVGTYRVYYSVSETGTYRDIEDYDIDYEIRYLTSSVDSNMGATTSGTYEVYGTDRYYRTPVTVTANAGFEMKSDDVFDEDEDVEPFSDSFIIDDDGYHYGALAVFRRKSDGATSQAEYVNTMTYFIDTAAPEVVAESVVDEKGNTPDIQVKDGTEFHAKKIEFDIHDIWNSEADIYEDALASVTVNGEAVDIADGIAHVEITTPRGVKTYEIVAVDRAGNTNSMTLSIEYLKDVPTTTMSMADSKYGSVLAAPVVETDSDQDESEYTYYYKEKGADDDTYTTTAPTAVGDYTVKVEIPASDLYTATSATADFSISYLAAPIDAYEISGTKGENGYYTSDVYLNAPDGYTISSSVNGSFADSIKYSDNISEVYLKRTLDGALTSAIKVDSLLIDKDKPLIADRALDSDGYELELLDGNAMKAKSLSFTVQDVNLSSVTVNGEKVDVADGNADVYIKATIGERVAYEVVAKDIAGNQSKLSFTLEYGVKIVPAATVSLGDYYVGQSLEPVVNTDSDGVADAVFEYKPASAADISYSTSVPVTAGTYMVRATIPETEKYKGISCVDEFELSFLDAPEEAYTLSGTEGKNDFYTSEVYMVAPNGYSISTSFGGTYTRSVRYEDGIKTIYLRRTTDGALTNGIAFNKEVKIDMVSPAVSVMTDQDGKAVVGSNKVYADTLNVKVSDENLDTVTLDGTSVTVSDKIGTAFLDSENGEKTFTILAEDKAGNTLSTSVTLTATWLIDKVIPADKLLPLTPGQSYKLDGGQWTVDGDTTVYNGGFDVYVNTAASHTFTKTN